jgi:hypothetical protein
LAAISIVKGISSNQKVLWLYDITEETSISELSNSLVKEVLDLSVVISVFNSSLQSNSLLILSGSLRGRWIIGDRFSIIPSGDVGVV